MKIHPRFPWCAFLDVLAYFVLGRFGFVDFHSHPHPSLLLSLSTHTLAHSGYPCVAHYALITVVVLIALLFSYVLLLVPHPLSICLFLGISVHTLPIHI